MSRDTFEELLAAMARTGVIQHQEATFDKGGKKIPYRTVRLTPSGYRVESGASVDLLIKHTDGLRKDPPRRKKGKKPSSKKVVAEAESSSLEGALRNWRLGEARKQGVPAFRILSDQVLRNVASRRPTTDGDLLAISGVGLAKVKRYGSQIYRIVHGGQSAT